MGVQNIPQRCGEIMSALGSGADENSAQIASDDPSVPKLPSDLKDKPPQNAEVSVSQSGSHNNSREGETAATPASKQSQGFGKNKGQKRSSHKRGINVLNGDWHVGKQKQPKSGSQVYRFPFLDPIQDLVHRKQLIRLQIEYYFSINNLCRDFYLRKNMDENGWIDLDLILSFNRIRVLTPYVEVVKDALKNSTEVEICDNKIRKLKDDGRGHGYWALKAEDIDLSLFAPPTSGGVTYSKVAAGAATAGSAKKNEVLKNKEQGAPNVRKPKNPKSESSATNSPPAQQITGDASNPLPKPSAPRKPKQPRSTEYREKGEDARQNPHVDASAVNSHQVIPNGEPSASPPAPQHIPTPASTAQPKERSTGKANTYHHPHHPQHTAPHVQSNVVNQSAESQTVSSQPAAAPTVLGVANPTSAASVASTSSETAATNQSASRKPRVRQRKPATKPQEKIGDSENTPKASPSSTTVVESQRRVDSEAVRSTAVLAEMLMLLHRPVIPLFVPYHLQTPRAAMKAKKSWKQKFVVWHLIFILAVLAVAAAAYVRYFTDLIRT
eukprot:c5219_g1_i3.p1 GENE.c5219_g1_i3~~c5219_g1_i3.p1  ORF type:complete len:554 (-),score=78.12 c5219_g1_i3:56-1717(-)